MTRIGSIRVIRAHRRGVSRILAFILTALYCLALNPCATAQAAAPAPIHPQLKFEKYRLKNGLDVILSEDHRVPLVAVNLWYHVGPANERPGRTGFAHLFEHMMFEGSKHVGSKAHFRYLEGAGASDINGTTEFDRTNYFETLPSNQLELALWLESDRMGFLLSTLDREKLANQRDVVRNERRQSTEGQPYGLVEEELYHQLFPNNHPYYAAVIGSHRDIEAARLNDVREFFRQYYTPNNASLAIVGDFDPARTKALVEKYFGTLPAGPPVPKITATTPAITAERRSTVTDRVELPRLYMGWITPPIFSKDDAEADLLAQILGGGKSSRLYKELVYKKQIAQDVEVQNQSLLLGSVFELQATAKPGVKLEEIEHAIEQELSRLRTEGPSQAELDRARNLTETRIIQRLERLGGFGGKADRLNMYNHFLGDPGYLPKDLARYDNITTESLKRVAGEQLKTNGRVVVYGIPGKKVIDDPPRTKEEDEKEAMVKSTVAANESDEPWRANPPPPGPPSRLQLPLPTSFKLENGLTVLLVEQHELPVVAANLVILSGSDANPPDKSGLASFTAAMLQEGTTTRSALQTADDAAQIGATLNTFSNSDYSAVTVQSLKNNIAPALDLVSDLALRPKFDEKEIERIRKQRLTEILQNHDDPFQTGLTVFNRAVYGTGHPYGYHDLGTTASNRAITPAEMESFWKAGYRAANSALVFAGDLTPSEARSLARNYFGGWTGAATRHQAPKVETTASRTIYLVDKPGAPQSALLVGGVGVARSTPDYAAIRVMNAALGGNFSSRLNMNLREQHGYTYGALSRFAFRRGAGPYFVGGAIRTDATAPALEETLKELDHIRSVPLSADELRLAKGSVSLSLAGLFETSPDTARTVSGLFVYDLPFDYYRRLPAQIDQVDAAQVAAAAAKYVKPEAAAIVIVGDRAKVEPGIRKLQLGTIEFRNEEGDLVRTDPPK
jgi:zinc protease